MWETLEAMGFSPLFIRLIQGLILGGTFVIHANGLFSKVVNLDWGIIQGCPLSAFLYALTSQPLMALLKQRAREGSLRGILLDKTSSK